MSDHTPPPDYCTRCHWPLACSNAECPTVAKAGAPPPALGELARTLAELAQLATAAMPTPPATNAWFTAKEFYANGYHPDFAAFLAACSPEVVLQLVALASGGGAMERARDAWREYAEHAAGCVECGETSWENCDDGPHGPGGRALRAAAIEADALTATAAPPGYTDIGQCSQCGRAGPNAWHTDDSTHCGKCGGSINRGTRAPDREAGVHLTQLRMVARRVLTCPCGDGVRQCDEADGLADLLDVLDDIYPTTLTPERPADAT